MKRLCGLCLFWMGVGMATWILFPRSLCSLLIAIVLIIVGYNLFCSCSNKKG